MPVSLNYLAAHARNLEALLQTYRQIHLTTQSVFLVLGTFLLSQVLGASDLAHALFLEALLVTITVFSNLVMMKFSRVIRQRGEDVDWWYRKIIRLEQDLPPGDRLFTQFKMYQSRDRLEDENLARFLSESEPVSSDGVEVLLDADLDQVRRVINTYILRGIRLIWVVILFISTIGILFRLMT